MITAGPHEHTRLISDRPASDLLASDYTASDCPASDRPYRRAAVALLLVAVSMAGSLVSQPALAGSGLEILVPGGKPQNRLRVKLETWGVNGNGYRPVKIQLQSWPKVQTFDREFRVMLHPHSWVNRRQAVVRTITLPAGTANVDEIIRIPQMGHWHDLQLDVFEGNSRLEDLSRRFNLTTASNEWSEGWPTALFIDRDVPQRPFRNALITQINRGTTTDQTVGPLPDVRAVTRVVSHNTWFDPANPPRLQPTNSMATLALVKSDDRLEMLPPSELSERWIDLTCYDMIFLSMEDLLRLKQQFRKRWDAVRSWAAGGPTLFVYGVGQNFERLSELREAMEIGLDPPGDATTVDDSPLELRGWVRPRPENFALLLRSDSAFGQRAAAPSTYRNRRKRSQLSVPEPGFVTRPLGLGTLVAIGPSDAFTSVDFQPQWSWIMSTLGGDRLMWFRRHGISGVRQNNEVWNYVIPGVGLPPVNSFLVLISIFVLIIGPANYFVLRKTGRLYLLLLTVPIGATVATGALFGWALITDGISVRTRVRSFTQIDQRNQQAVSWSRQTYYAAMPPSRGLGFPLDTVVYPIYDDPRELAGNNGPSRTLAWGDQQEFRDGYLQARTSSQFLVIRARTSTVGVEIRETADVHGKNQLRAQAKVIVICDSRGGFHIGRKVAAGDTFKATQVTAEEAQEELKKWFVDNIPAVPKDFDPNYYNYYSRRRWYYYGNSHIDDELTVPSAASSILEHQIAANCYGAAKLPPRTWVAIVDRSPEVPLGARGTRPSNDFHVMQGKW